MPETNENEHRRLTPTEKLHEVTLAALTQRQRPQSETIEITRNAKGDVQFTVNATAQDGETLKDAADRAQVLFDQLSTRYPTAEGHARRVETSPTPTN